MFDEQFARPLQKAPLESTLCASGSPEERRLAGRLEEGEQRTWMCPGWAQEDLGWAQEDMGSMSGRRCARGRPDGRPNM